METVLTLVIGLIGGIAVGTQGPIGGAMGSRIGGAASSFVIHLGGAVASVVLLVFRGGERIGEWRKLPWYMLGSGVLGLVLYLTLNHTVQRVGAASAITLVIVGQLFAGMAIDYFGAFGIPVRALDPSRIIAVALLLSGAYMMMR